jgi:hypothetical protein
MRLFPGHVASTTPQRAISGADLTKTALRLDFSVQAIEFIGVFSAFFVIDL